MAEVRLKGIYRSGTFGTKHKAQAWALEMEQAAGRLGGIVTGKTFGEAMARYAAEVSPGKKGGRWEEIRLKKLQRDRIADIGVADLRTEDIQAWVARQTIAPNSIRRELGLMSTVLRAARVKWKWMAHEPMRDVEKPKAALPRDRIISDEERDRILLALGYDEAQPVASTRQHIAVLFLLALETAMRQGELLRMDWTQVRLSLKFATLLETKNGTRRDVPLSTCAVALFERLNPKPSGRIFPLRQSVVEVQFRRAVQLAGIDDLHFHDTRHTAITRLARKLDVLDLARMVGHKDLRSLQIYYNPHASDLAARLD